MPCGRLPAAGWVVTGTKKRVPQVGVSRLTKFDVSLVSQHGCFFKTQLPAFWEGWGTGNWKLKNHLEKESQRIVFQPKKMGVGDSNR